MGIDGNVPHNDEKELVTRCKKGDKQAFERLVLNYQQKVFQAVYWMVGDAEEAKDLAQDVFVKAFLDIKKFKEKSSLFTWLNWIIIDLCSRKFRSKKEKKEKKKISLDKPTTKDDDKMKLQVSDGSIGVLENIIKEERDKVIHSAIDELKPKYRMVLVLCDIENLSYLETADILKCSEGTVKSRLFRARLLLRDELKKILP